MNDKDKDGNHVRRLVFEHRDEPPIDEYFYTRKDGKRQHHWRYRRCNVGKIKYAQFPTLGEPDSEIEEEEEEEEAVPAAVPVVVVPVPKPEIRNGTDWEKKYKDLLVDYTILLKENDTLKREKSKWIERNLNPNPNN